VFWLALDLVLSGERSRSAGWMARARRLLDDEDCVEAGYLLALDGLQSYLAGDAARARDLCGQGMAIAVRFAEPDLLSFAMVGVGEALIRLGEPDEGVRLLDEAMIAVIADEVSPIVAGLAYCAVVASCHEAFDVRRAREWTAELTRWCAAQQGLVPYRGVCLAHRVEVLRLEGEWADAMDEAVRACAWLDSVPFKQSADAVYYQLGELRRLRGEYPEALAAYRAANRFGHTAQPGLALTLLASGDLRGAEGAIRTALEASHEMERRCRVLPAFVEVMLATDRVDEARRASAELEALAMSLGAPLLGAISARCTGAVLLAGGEPRDAQRVLGPAFATFRDLEAPYDAALVRLLIGLCCRELGDEVTARMEIEAAKAAFRQMGAAPDLLRAEELSLPAPDRAASLLTRRELEVLRHVAAGKSNRMIATDLVLSEKTVARHVSNILGKLGVSSRSAATSYAHKHALL
jgi:DNA-binding CsgD family transcriptional regulator/tetratricopeptide (TPR) repeat protein